MSAPLAVSERSYGPEPATDRHPFHQIVFPERGRLEMQVAGERGCAGEIHFASIPAGAEHRYWADGPNRFLILDLAPFLIEDVQRDTPTARRPARGAFRPLDEPLALLASLLRAEMARGGVHEPLVVESLGRYAASLLCRASTANPLGGSSVGARRLALRTRDLLESDYLQPLTLARIAADVGASVAHVQRTFRAHFDVTVVEYLQSLRLERARGLLLTTDFSVTEVAFASGFHDPGYFSRRFAREIGVSPSAYRAALRAGSDTNSR